MPFTICHIKRPSLFAIIDGNNFFVSCERAFNPSLNSKPVIVLSNNDGCAISRSNEAKNLGIAMGAPLHTFSHMIKPYGITVFSSNFELYGDLSNRMMQILQTFSPDVEVYSIDEAFLDFSRLPIRDYKVIAKSMCDTVLNHIGIPITIGIAATKTLAKAANRVAKKQRSSLLVLQTNNEIKNVLEETDIGSVWGVGKALTPKLKSLGIYTAQDLALKDPRWARKHLTITGERMVRELQGISCIPFNDTEPVRQSIQVTRSFGMRLTQFDDIAEAVSAHATSLGEQLRKKNLVTSTIAIFCRTSPFGTTPYYKGVGIIGFEYPTNDTSTLINAAIKALRQAYKDGHSYQAAGVHSTNLMPDGSKTQKNILTNHISSLIVKSNPTQKSFSFNKSIDTINQKYGHNTLFFASSGINPKHKTKQIKRSPRYTTNWGELLNVV